MEEEEEEKSISGENKNKKSRKSRRLSKSSVSRTLDIVKAEDLKFGSSNEIN